jgi:hypothetical protein
MPAIRDAVIVLGIILGCCLFVALGAYLGKALTLTRLAKLAGAVSLIAIMSYTVYTSWMSLFAN